MYKGALCSPQAGEMAAQQSAARLEQHSSPIRHLSVVIAAAACSGATRRQPW